MSAPAPICAECRHMLPEWMCNRPGVEHPESRVTGEPILPTCAGERASADRCGKDGRYWTERNA
jgi:hypothetical protein